MVFTFILAKLFTSKENNSRLACILTIIRKW